MKRFEYEITKHPAEKFTRVVTFCSEEGECKLDQVPADQMTVLGDILNERGSEGWEVIQLSFGNDGVVVFWKREM
jgi:hypothetical protein